MDTSAIRKTGLLGLKKLSLILTFSFIEIEVER
jgi:hypothetical protein